MFEICPSRHPARLQAHNVAGLPEDLRPHWDELDKHYKIRQNGHDGKGDFLQHKRCDLYGFETWLSRIAFSTKELVAKDLKVVEMVRVPFAKIGRSYLGRLRIELQPRFEALASLEQTETPQAMKVFCVLLRELWETRITDGTSKLAEQSTSILQNLCKLIQNAMEGWEKVKRLDHWCWHFCWPLWALRASRGRGPPDPSIGFSKAFEDLQVIQAEAEKIIAARPVTQKEWEELKSSNDNLKRQVAEMLEKFEKLQQDALRVHDHEKEMENELADLKSDNSKMKEELADVKSKNDHVKHTEGQLEQKVNQLEQDALNTNKVNKKQQSELLAIKEELGQLRNDQFKMKEELQELKMKRNDSWKTKTIESGSKNAQGTVLEYVTRALNDLSMQCQRLQLNEIAKTEVSECCSEVSWIQVHQDGESNMLRSASSAFSVETNGPRCFMLDAVFKTPSGAFLSGADL